MTIRIRNKYSLSMSEPRTVSHQSSVTANVTNVAVFPIPLNLLTTSTAALTLMILQLEGTVVSKMQKSQKLHKVCCVLTPLKDVSFGQNIVNFLALYDEL